MSPTCCMFSENLFLRTPMEGYFCCVLAYFTQNFLLKVIRDEVDITIGHFRQFKWIKIIYQTLTWVKVFKQEITTVLWLYWYYLWKILLKLNVCNTFISHSAFHVKALCTFNSLIPGGNKKVTHTETNLQLSGAGLFKYVWPFC